MLQAPSKNSTTNDICLRQNAALRNSKESRFLSWRRTCRPVAMLIDLRNRHCSLVDQIPKPKPRAPPCRKYLETPEKLYRSTRITDLTVTLILHGVSSQEAALVISRFLSLRSRFSRFRSAFAAARASSLSYIRTGVSGRGARPIG